VARRRIGLSRHAGDAPLARAATCRGSGWTLVELLIALTIAALLVGLASPHYHAWIADYELMNHARQLAGAMNIARAEAVKRGSRVGLCKSPDRRLCTSGGGWEQGFIMYADVDRDGRVDTGEVPLRADGLAPPGITVRGNRPVADYVSYTGLGTTRLLNGGLQMGTFTVCRSGLRAIDVVLANSGRARIQRTGAVCP
jgi:type IV fimbrial biogenesis protein FimT